MNTSTISPRAPALFFLLLAALSAGVHSQTPMGQYELTVIHQWSSSSIGDVFGCAAATVGDLDGDGLPDVIVGANQFSNPGPGMALSFSGASGAFIATITDGATSSTWQLGGSIAALGDINSDGTDDFAIGAPQANTNSGLVRVFSGADSSILYTVNACGCSPDDRFGATLASIGDIDGDGTTDFLVGATSDDPGTGHYAGRVWAISGATGSVIYTVNGAAAEFYLGRSLKAGPDVDGDGIQDFIVGEPQGTGIGPGIARLCSGATGTTIHSWTGDMPFDLFGGQTSFIGDIDLDGTADVLIIASGSDAHGIDRGLARAFSGATGALIYEIVPSASIERLFGYGQESGTIAPIPDVDNDGIPDFLIGSGSVSNGMQGPMNGSVQAFSGASGTLLAQLMGAMPNDHFGSSVQALGDINGDGTFEVFIGAPSDGTKVGSASIYKLDATYTPPYPGSGADLSLAVGINGSGTLFPLVHAATGGDYIQVHFWSPVGTYNFTPPLLVAQLFPTGAPYLGPAAYPEVHIGEGVAPPNTAVVLYDGSFLGFTSALSPGGFQTTAIVPLPLPATSVMIQGFVLSANPGNQLFTSTDAHEIQIQ